MSRITLISPKIKGFSGTSSYINNVINGFRNANVEFDLKLVTKREISLFGKPFFGIFYQALSSKLIRTSTPIVHALATEVVTSHTNVVTVHDIIPFTNPEIYIHSLYDKIAYKVAFEGALKVKNILVSTNQGKDQLIEKLGVKEENIHVVYHSIDHSRYFPEKISPYPEGEKSVVMVSDFNPRKRIDLLVKVIRNYPDISFYHIGPSQKWANNMKKISELAEGYHNIHILGPMDTEVVRRYLSNADLFVYLSEDEGFGYPILEAMACGSNVLLNDIPVFKELFTGYANFCNLDSFSIDSIYNAMKNKKSENDLISFSKRFTIKKMVENILKVYDSLN